MIRPLSLLFSVGLLLVSPALPGCGDDREWQSVKQESGEAWDAVKTWGVARRQDAERLLSKSLGSLRQEVEDAKVRARASGGGVADGLESKWDDVSRKFSEMQSASADRWGEARDAFVRGYEALKREVAQGRQP